MQVDLFENACIIFLVATSAADYVDPKIARKIMELSIHYCKTLIFCGHIILAILAVKVKITKIYIRQYYVGLFAFMFEYIYICTA